MQGWHLGCVLKELTDHCHRTPGAGGREASGLPLKGSHAPSPPTPVLLETWRELCSEASLLDVQTAPSSLGLPRACLHPLLIKHQPDWSRAHPKVPVLHSSPLKGPVFRHSHIPRH